MVTEDGLALGAGVSRSNPDSGSWVTLGVTVDVWPCPVSAAGCRPGRALWRWFSCFGEAW